MVVTVLAVREDDISACPPGRGPAPERGAQSISQLEIVTAPLSDVDQLDNVSPAGSTAPSVPFGEVTQVVHPADRGIDMFQVSAGAS